MLTLFTTDEKDLKQFLEILTEDEIRDCCPSKVYYRGKEYYENDLVSSAASGRKEKGRHRSPQTMAFRERKRSY